MKRETSADQLLLLVMVVVLLMLMLVVMVLLMLVIVVMVVLLMLVTVVAVLLVQPLHADPSHPKTLRPGGRLLFRFFLEPKSLTRENTFSLLGLSLAPLLLLGLPLPRHAFAFSRSRACRFWRMRELAMAAARDMFRSWSEAARAAEGEGGLAGGGAEVCVSVCV